MEPDTLLTVSDVAELTQLSLGTIYHLVSQKRIPVIRISARCLRFRRSDIEAWLLDKTSTPQCAERSHQEQKTR